MDDRPWLYYKLTNEPKGSGELKSMFDRYYCINIFFCSKALEKLLQKVLFTCTYNGAEKHVTCEHSENAASRAKTNVITTVHFTDDDVSFNDGPGMLICKTAKPCINSAWIALLIHGFVPVKTWLLTAWDTALFMQLWWFFKICIYTVVELSWWARIGATCRPWWSSDWSPRIGWVRKWWK